MKIKLTIAYCGTDFFGYQLQGEKPTVSLALNQAVKEVFSVPCNVTGCSRTDQGVHALGFCACVSPKNKNDKISVPVSKIPIALNRHLPEGVSVLDAQLVPDSFHPRYDVVKKEYIYKIHDSQVRNPFYRHYALEYGKAISDESLEKMNEGAKQILGTHEFDSFMAVGSKIKDTRRTVLESYFVRNGDTVEYHICADGFLYNMVRIIVGTLLRIDAGKLQPNDVLPIIEAKDRSKAGATVKADGLYLKKVFYNS